jgi:hypothetical protein
VQVYAEWLREQGVEVTVTVEHAALDPFRGYMNAIRDELPDATAVLDAFHVVKLAGNALDEVRRRVQQAALHRRGHKDDPLYRIRRTLLTGTEHLTDRQRHRLLIRELAAPRVGRLDLLRRWAAIAESATLGEGWRVCAPSCSSRPSCPTLRRASVFLNCTRTSCGRWILIARRAHTDGRC